MLVPRTILFAAEATQIFGKESITISSSALKSCACFRIKIFRIPLNKSRKAFLKEAFVWKQLQYPNILPFLGVNDNEFSPRLCFVSPWMSNGNILTFLNANPKHNRLTVIAEIAEGLAYLHGLTPPIVHGDVKSANVLVTNDGHCCLADFGLALTLGNSLSNSTGHNAWSLRWQAPELLSLSASESGHPIKTARDIYAFACTVFEIFTGQAPFKGETDGAVVLHVREGKRPERLPNDDIPNMIWSLMEDCWAQKASDRLSAREIVKYFRDAETMFKHPIYALVVGIDQYQAFSQLCGCVKDAQNFFRYLHETRGVPQDHICILLDLKATRKGILESFRSHLLNNTAIKKEDDPTIVFYFAGHGGSIPVPARSGDSSDDSDIDGDGDGDMNIEDDSDDDTDYVDTICPVDDGMPDPDHLDQEISGIPCLTINALLDEVARKKGNNIIMISDSCDSRWRRRRTGWASIHPSLTIREAEPSDHYGALGEGCSLLQTEIALWRRSVPLECQKSPSHIILTPSRIKQSACEDPDERSGIFTDALISQLKSPRFHAVKYLELIQDIQEQVENRYRSLIDCWLYHPWQDGSGFRNQDLAIEHLTKYLEAGKYSSNAQTWYLLGLAYMASQRYFKAYEAYQQAVYRDGRNPIIWCSIGALYFEIGQLDDALDAYSRAIRIDPNIFEAGFNLGSLYENCNNINQFGDAINAYARAAELRPENTMIKERLALLREAQRNGGVLPQGASPTSQGNSPTNGSGPASNFQDIHPTVYSISVGPPGFDRERSDGEQGRERDQGDKDWFSLLAAAQRKKDDNVPYVPLNPYDSSASSQFQGESSRRTSPRLPSLGTDDDYDNPEVENALMRLADYRTRFDESQ